MKEASAQSQNRRPKQGRRADFPRLLGGNLCLDFVNSIEGRRDRHPVEFLHSYEDVVHWGEHAGVLSQAHVAALLEAAQRQPHEAQASFERAIALREALHRVFVAQAHDAQPLQDDLDQLQHSYLAALSHATFAQTSNGYAWQFPDDAALDTVLWHVARAAVDLLGSSAVQRIKECPGADDCGWLFFDASKNGSRRWCSMEGCGSRVKMRHQYARKRST